MVVAGIGAETALSAQVRQAPSLVGLKQQLETQEQIASMVTEAAAQAMAATGEVQPKEQPAPLLDGARGSQVNVET